MAIAYASTGTRCLVGSAATNWTVAYPATVNSGDLLILFVSSNGGGPVTASGWTEVHNEATVSNPQGALFYKVAAGTEGGTNDSISVAVATTGNANIFRYTGVDTTTPLDASSTSVSNTASGTSVVLPAITTVTADTMLVYVASGNSSSTTMSSGTGTERVDHGSLGGTGTKSGALYDQANASTGSTGTRTITLSASRMNWGAMIALRPAGSGFTGSASLSGSGSLTRTVDTFSVSASPSLSGSGTLARSVTVGFAVNLSLTGSGTQTRAVAGLSITASVALGGSGTLSVSGSPVSDFNGSVSLDGSGTQTRSVAGLSLSATASFSGAGSLTESVVMGASGNVATSGEGALGTNGALASTGSVSLSGSGSLTLSVKAGFTSGLSLSGTGNRTLDNSALGLLGSSALSGNGTLSRAVTAGALGSVTLTGTGTLSRSGVPAILAPLPLSGDGTFEAEAVMAFTGSVSRTGSGSLTTSVNASLTGASALSGSGSLTTSMVVNFSASRALSGSGSLGIVGEVPFTPVAVDKTNIDPVPYVTIGGVDVPTSLYDGGYVALEGLRINWGRDTLLDDVSPAQLSLTIYDSTGAWVKNQPFLGLEIITGVNYTDKAGVARGFRNFRGRIVEAEVEEYVRTKQDGADEHGYMIHITAADKLAELGNLFMSNQSWPSEDAAARRSRLQTALGGLASGIGGPYDAGVTYCAKSFDQKSMLELVTEYFGSTAQFINYDPDTNRLESVDRLEYGGQGLRLGEIDNRAGTYGMELDAAGLSNRQDYVLDSGSLVARSGIRRTVESTVTEIRYEYPTSAAGTAKTTNVMTTNLPSESLYGRRTFAVTSEVIDNVANFTTSWNILVRAAQGWSPPDVEWDTRREERGFQSNPHINTMLRGRVYLDPLFMSRSVYNAFPMLNATTGTLRVRLPIYWVIGGEMYYGADASGTMGWVVRPKFASVIYYSDWTPLTWSTINPSAPGNTVAWHELDENVTWTDINLTGQGI